MSDHSLILLLDLNQYRRVDEIKFTGVLDLKIYSSAVISANKRYKYKAVKKLIRIYL